MTSSGKYSVCLLALQMSVPILVAAVHIVARSRCGGCGNLAAIRKRPLSVAANLRFLLQITMSLLPFLHLCWHPLPATGVGSSRIKSCDKGEM